VEVYLKPIRKNKVLPPDKVPLIFSNIEEIVEENKKLLNILEARWQKWWTFQKLADIFLDLENSFVKVYSHYVSNYDKGVESIDTAFKNANFAKFVVKCEEDNYSSKAVDDLSLEGFLIAPVQRLPRYVLLLQEILNFTPEDHPDYDNMSRATDYVRSLVTAVNDSKRKQEYISELMNIQISLSNYTDSLVTPYRRLMKKGQIIEHLEPSLMNIFDSKKEVQRYIFICSDIVLITKMKKKKFDVSDVVAIDEAKIEDVEGHKDTFRLMSRKKSFVFKCESENEKKEWCDLLHELISTPPRSLSSRTTFSFASTSLTAGNRASRNFA